jgi:hypothetical protein
MAIPVLKVMEAPIPFKSREAIRKRGEGAMAENTQERV